MKYFILFALFLMACASAVSEEPANCIQTGNSLQCEEGEPDLLPLKTPDQDPEFSEVPHVSTGN